MRGSIRGAGRAVGTLAALMALGTAGSLAVAVSPASASGGCQGSEPTICAFPADGLFTIPKGIGVMHVHLVGGAGAQAPQAPGDGASGGHSVPVDADFDASTHAGEQLIIHVAGNGNDVHGGHWGGGQGTCGTYVQRSCGGGGGGASSIIDAGLGILAVSPGGGGGGGEGSQRDGDGNRSGQAFPGGGGGDGNDNGANGWGNDPGADPLNTSVYDGSGGQTPAGGPYGEAGRTWDDLSAQGLALGYLGQGGQGAVGSNRGVVCNQTDFNGNAPGTGAGGGGGGGGYIGGGGGGGAGVYDRPIHEGLDGCNDGDVRDQGTWAGGGGAGGESYVDPLLSDPVIGPPTADQPIVIISYGPGLPPASAFSYYHYALPRHAGDVFTVIDSRTLPPGISINADGVLYGVPTRNGVYDFSVLRRDAGEQDSTFNVRLLVGLLPPSWPDTTVHGVVGSLTPGSIEHPPSPSGWVFHYPDKVVGTVSDRLTVGGASIAAAGGAGGVRVLASGSAHLAGTGRGTLHLRLTRLGRHLLGRGRPHARLRLVDQATLTVGGKRYTQVRRLSVRV